jgi:hypothetical protein
VAVRADQQGQNTGPPTNSFLAETLPVFQIFSSEIINSAKIFQNTVTIPAIDRVWY